MSPPRYHLACRRKCHFHADRSFAGDDGPTRPVLLKNPAPSAELSFFRRLTGDSRVTADNGSLSWPAPLYVSLYRGQAPGRAAVPDLDSAVLS